MRNPILGCVCIILSILPFAAGERLPGRYIVELTTEPVAAHTRNARGPAATAHRGRIRGEQARIKPLLSQKGAAVLETVDTVANAMFVQIPDSTASELASLPGVKRVIPVRMFYPVLDRALLLHKVPDAWDVIGGSDQAGIGMKIGIIDSGIEVTHPGFQDPSLTPPASFPRTTNASDSVYTSSKVIVARSYVNLLPHRDPDTSARDRQGHGTAVAMVAAGVRNAGPMATITGVAPKAFLGNYKVFGSPNFNEGSTSDAIIKAMDDAVADGMDVISMSLGDPLASRLADDIEVQAVERATQAGVIVVIAAGNSGPDLNTISSPASAPSAISVGASSNDRTFAAKAEMAGQSPFVAIPGNGPTPGSPITANIADVQTLDGNGQACSALPSGSLTGQIALILRGTCNFENKLINAQAAGALAALVYATTESPEAIPMDVRTATLPAMMVGNPDGTATKQAIASQSPVVMTLRFDLSSAPVAPNRLTDFTAAGPNVDLGIKPDLIAVGENVYTAAETFDSNGELYDQSGYALVDGTSFSTPLVAGAAALLKAARPGLSVDQYRSLLINSAAQALNHTGQAAGVQLRGAGLLDANAAARSTITAYPTSLSFGSGDGNPQVSRTLTLGNLGATDETFTITVNGTDIAPSVSSGTLTIGAGSTANVSVSLNASALPAGAHEGSLSVTATSSGSQITVPFWYGVMDDVPARITILDSIDAARRGSTQIDAVLFRVTNAAGVPLTNMDPQASAITGGGTVRGVVSHDVETPGVFGLNVRLGTVAGLNVFQIQAGSVTRQFSITGQ